MRTPAMIRWLNKIAVVVLDVERIGDAMQGFSANVFFLACWSDPRLAHDGAFPSRTCSCSGGRS